MVKPPKIVTREDPLCVNHDAPPSARRTHSLQSGAKTTKTPGQKGCVNHDALGVRRAACTPSIGRVRQERSPVREVTRALTHCSLSSREEKRGT